jgi:hypothetical protein
MSEYILSNYQNFFIDKLLFTDLHGVLLCYCTGSGKTRMSLYIAHRLMLFFKRYCTAICNITRPIPIENRTQTSEPSMYNIIILATVQTKKIWKKEYTNLLKHFINEEKQTEFDLVISNIESFYKNVHKYTRFVLIIDEAHKLLNGQLISIYTSICQEAWKVILCTATPCISDKPENDIVELLKLVAHPSEVPDIRIYNEMIDYIHSGKLSYFLTSEDKPFHTTYEKMTQMFQFSTQSFCKNIFSQKDENTDLSEKFQPKVKSKRDYTIKNKIIEQDVHKLRNIIQKHMFVFNDIFINNHLYPQTIFKSIVINVSPNTHADFSSYLLNYKKELNFLTQKNIKKKVKQDKITKIDSRKENADESATADFLVKSRFHNVFIKCKFIAKKIRKGIIKNKRIVFFCFFTLENRIINLLIQLLDPICTYVTPEKFNTNLEPNTFTVISNQHKEGLDLYTACILIFLTLPFRWYEVEQFMGRVKRKGKNTNGIVKIYMLILKFNNVPFEESPDTWIQGTTCQQYYNTNIVYKMINILLHPLRERFVQKYEFPENKIIETDVHLLRFSDYMHKLRYEQSQKELFSKYSRDEHVDFNNELLATVHSYFFTTADLENLQTKFSNILFNHIKDMIESEEIETETQIALHELYNFIRQIFIFHQHTLSSVNKIKTRFNNDLKEIYAFDTMLTDTSYDTNIQDQIRYLTNVARIQNEIQKRYNSPTEQLQVSKDKNKSSSIQKIKLRNLKQLNTLLSMKIKNVGHLESLNKLLDEIIEKLPDVEHTIENTSESKNTLESKSTRYLLNELKELFAPKVAQLLRLVDETEEEIYIDEYTTFSNILKFKLLDFQQKLNTLYSFEITKLLAAKEGESITKSEEKKLKRLQKIEKLSNSTMNNIKIGTLCHLFDTNIKELSNIREHTKLSREQERELLYLNNLKDIYTFQLNIIKECSIQKKNYDERIKKLFDVQLMEFDHTDETYVSIKQEFGITDNNILKTVKKWKSYLMCIHKRTFGSLTSSKNINIIKEIYKFYVMYFSKTKRWRPKTIGMNYEKLSLGMTEFEWLDEWRCEFVRSVTYKYPSIPIENIYAVYDYLVKENHTESELCTFQQPSSHLDAFDYMIYYISLIKHKALQDTLMPSVGNEDLYVDIHPLQVYGGLGKLLHGADNLVKFTIEELGFVKELMSPGEYLQYTNQLQNQRSGFLQDNDDSTISVENEEEYGIHHGYMTEEEEVY